MRKITVLYDGTLYTYIWLKAILTLKSYFRERGYKLELLNILSYLPVAELSDKQLDEALKQREFDILLLAFHHSTSDLGKMTSEGRIELLKRLKAKSNRLVWLDTADSTGSCVFDILPVVDKYLKKQLYHDLSLYKQNLYLDRVYADFYAKQQSVEAPADDGHQCLLQDKYIGKIGVSWNIGLNDFLSPKILRLVPNRICYPKIERFSTERQYDIFFNGTVQYSSLVSYQRLKVCDYLKANELSKNIPDPGLKMSHKEYIEYMKNSKACISPFGWGEICYRDFESFFYGATLLKPTVDHMNTFPNFFIKNETYIPIDWNFDNINDVFELVGSEQYKEVAKNGQELYLDYINGKKDEIVDHILYSIMN